MAGNHVDLEENVEAEEKGSCRALKQHFCGIGCALNLAQPTASHHEIGEKKALLREGKE